MHAIQLEQPGRFRTITIPEPNQPAPGDALVRVHRVGICGTDISGYLGKMPFYSYPRIPGHELGVEIIAVGSGVDNLRPVGHRRAGLGSLPPVPGWRPSTSLAPNTAATTGQPV